MSKKYKKVYRILNCIEHLLILISTVTGVVSIYAFAFLVAILIAITSSAIGLKNCVIIPGIKKYDSIIKNNPPPSPTKKKKKQDKMVSLAKSKLNNADILISNALIDSNITHNAFVLIHNVPKEFDDLKKEIKKSNDK